MLETMLLIYHLQGPTCALGGQSFIIVSPSSDSPHSLILAEPRVSPGSRLTAYTAAQWFMCVSCFYDYAASTSRLGAPVFCYFPLCTHGAQHIVGTQYIFKKWLNQVLNSANIISPILLIPFQHFFFSCPLFMWVVGEKLLKRDVISLVNIITAVYYHSTKVITPSFSVACTHRQNYLRSRNSSCLFSVSEWNAAKLGEDVLSPFEWQVYEGGHFTSQEKEAGLWFVSR